MSLLRNFAFFKSKAQFQSLFGFASASFIYSNWKYLKIIQKNSFFIKTQFRDPVLENTLLSSVCESIFCMLELLVVLIHQLVRYHGCLYERVHISKGFSVVDCFRSFDLIDENLFHFLLDRRCSISNRVSSNSSSIRSPSVSQNVNPNLRTAFEYRRLQPAILLW